MPKRHHLPVKSEPQDRPPEKRLVVVHNFQWHLIISAIAALIYSLAQVLS